MQALQAPSSSPEDTLVWREGANVSPEDNPSPNTCSANDVTSCNPTPIAWDPIDLVLKYLGGYAAPYDAVNDLVLSPLGLVGRAYLGSDGNHYYQATWVYPPS